MGLDRPYSGGFVILFTWQCLARHAPSYCATFSGKGEFYLHGRTSPLHETFQFARTLSRVHYKACRWRTLLIERRKNTTLRLRITANGICLGGEGFHLKAIFLAQILWRLILYVGPLCAKNAYIISDGWLVLSIHRYYITCNEAIRGVWSRKNQNYQVCRHIRSKILTKAHMVKSGGSVTLFFSSYSKRLLAIARW